MPPAMHIKRRCFGVMAALLNTTSWRICSSVSLALAATPGAPMSDISWMACTNVVGE